jgi:hypothetical protein
MVICRTNETTGKRNAPFTCIVEATNCHEVLLSLARTGQAYPVSASDSMKLSKQIIILVHDSDKRYHNDNACTLLDSLFTSNLPSSYTVRRMNPWHTTGDYGDNIIALLTYSDMFHYLNSSHTCTIIVSTTIPVSHLHGTNSLTVLSCR